MLINGNCSETVYNDQRAYCSVLPYEKNQDVIYFDNANKVQVLSVVDGNNHKILGSYKPGREIAEFVAKEFPTKYLRVSPKLGGMKRAYTTAEAIEKKVLKKYPEYVSCVGAFAFDYGKYIEVVVVGSAYVYVLGDEGWYTPREIKDHSINPADYDNEADVCRLFGHGELKKKRDIYSFEPDFVKIPNSPPILICSDGTEELFDLEAINNIFNQVGLNDPKKFMSALRELIKNNLSLQNDDAAYALKI